MLIYDSKTMKQLIGFKITGTIVDEEGEFYGFYAKKGKQSVCAWILSDEEGNDVGCLDVVEEE